jgi:hypothetical protein
VETGKGKVVIVRPGQVVALDTTPLPVKVLDDVFGTPISVHLTVACARLVTDRVRCAGDAEIWLDSSLHQPRRRPARCWAFLAA